MDRSYPADPHPPVPSRRAPAKVNLGLHVLRRRPDGFHDLATVFVPIGWADVVTAEPAPTVTLTTDDPALPTDGTNLVVRAADALAAWARQPAGARLHLDKRVPYGAGLGGGSSDAAATLGLLVDLWGLDLPPATSPRSPWAWAPTSRSSSTASRRTGRDGASGWPR